MFNYYQKDKVFSFEKSPNEDVYFSLSERRGKTFADIRVYRKEDDGSKFETHKGIFLAFEKLVAMKEGIEKLIEAGQGKGEAA